MAAHLTVTALSLLIAGALGGCPDGWLRAGGYCYWLAPSTVSFQDAQGICSSKEASLVSLATRQDLNATLAVAASVSGVKQTWSCLRYDPSFQAWVWLDGTPYAANTVPWWGDKEPTLHSRGDTTEACAALDSAAARLHRVACTDRASPVCRRSAYKRELCNEEDRWRAMGSSCYKTFADQQTYWDADHTCRDHSATLLSLPFSDTIKSVIQQSVVCDTSDNDVWISSPNATRMTSSTQSTGSTAVPQPAVCNYVSVQYNLLLVTDTCLQERKFICVKPQGSCAKGWTGQDGRCYKTFVSKLPWFSASSQCGNLYAELLTISDSTEQQFVQSQMIAGKFPQQFWMGISDADIDGQLSHSDGTPVSMYYTAWGQGFPVDTPNATDCALITLGEKNATWSDGYCFTSRPYVCEMSVSDDINNDTNTDSCDVGWRLQGNACYLLGANKNYTAARDFCMASGGTLASARNNLDLSALAAIIPDASLAWIGLKKDDLSGQLVWEDTGTTLSLTNWLPGEPNNAGGGEDCVQMVGAAQRNMAGAWNDNNCSKPADFICQRQKRVSMTTPRPSSLVTVSWSARCGEGWLLSPVLSACYLLVTDVTVPWAAARAQCRRHSGDLVSVTSHREQTLMEAMVQSAGLAEGGEAWSGVWIGATDNTEEGGWEWSDGGPFRYLHWSAGQPDNRGWGGEEQDCAVAVPADTLTWDDRDCGELHNYICKKLAAPLSTTTPVTNTPWQPSGQCKGWAMISGDYYHVTDTMLGASTSRDEGHGPPMSRIYPGNTAAWMSDSNDDKPWVGVHFETLVTVKGVTTTGGLGLGTWVTQYKLQYRYDNSAPLYWYTSLPGSGAQVFTGNSDASTPVTNNIDLPFAARQVFLYPVNWTVSSPALRWELQGCLEDECTPDYAVSGPLIVPDDNITVSSVSDPQHDAFGARLHVIAVDMKLSCWRPATLDTSQWIQVDFERVEVLRGVSTRGNPTAAEWVTSYLLLFRPDVSKDGDVSFKPYEEPYGTVKVFSGNTDSNTTVTNYLKSHVPTQHVRIQPQSWQAHIALQLDILVCQTELKRCKLFTCPRTTGCQEQGLIKDVSDEQLTATSSEAHHGPAMVRLQPAGSPTSPLGTDHLYSGGWQAQFARQNEYIQVSLDLPQEIRAISTQGRHGSSNWVTSYSLTFSIDAKIWNNYTYDDTGSTMVFSGNYDADTVHKHYLTPFQAQYVRLHPVTWHGAVAMRWELHGCPGRNEMRVLGCYAEHPDDRDLPYEPYTDPMDGMDPLLCSRHCFNKGYYFAGLQARDKCYCGNSYGRYGPSADCNLWCFPQDQFICGGLAANFVYSTGLTSAFKVCPKGWPRLGEQCYSYTSTAYDWTSARAACAALRADLASVPDRNVNSLLYSLMGAASVPGPAWVGLSDRREARYYEWSDGQDVQYTDWDLHQPPPLVTGGEDRHCVAINNQTGGWMVADCSRHLPYLCVTDPRSSDYQPPIPPVRKGCQQGMVAYQSWCYVVTEENRTRSDATDVCASFNGQLLTVMNRFEQAYLASLLSSRQGLYWTDVSDIHDPGRFTYSEGQHDITYANWGPNMPDSHRHGHCVGMMAGRGAGLWRSEPCDVSLKAICKLPREGFPQPPVPPNKQHSACSTNWVDVNTSLCYQINNVGSNVQRTWVEARADCKEQGGELASFPNTPALDDFWRRKLLGSTNHFWIGLHAMPDGELQWSDRTVVSMDGPWSSDQPDTRNGTQNCMELHVTTGTLALRDCTLTRNWLCAIPQGRRPSQRLKDRIAPTAGPAQSCLPNEDTWRRYGDYCYTVFTNGSTWRQARKTCQRFEADLASIGDIKEQLIILSLAEKTNQQSVWIGLSELQSHTGYYGWSDGSRVKFVNWAGQGPDDANGQESCAEMFVRTGKWNDNHCALSQAFVCKRYASAFPRTTLSTLSPNMGGCGDGFVAFGGRCYIIRGQGGLKTWSDAVQDCESQRTNFFFVQLASIRSHRENAFLTTQLQGTGMLVWTGLHLVGHDYLWENNDDLTYTNWDTGEPNGLQNEGCVHLYSRGANAGRWNDADCSRKMGWICESDRFPYINTPTTTHGPCPSGFWRLGNSCYLFIPNPLAWSDAAKSCGSQGAHLVSVISQTEQDLVYLMASKNTSVTGHGLWLGMKGTMVGSETRWSWSDGWPVTFTRWSPGGDLLTAPSLACVAMGTNGTWSSVNCSLPRPYVCKTTSDTPPYTPAASNGVCDGRDWSPFGSYCFEFYLTQRVSFARAAFDCSQRGGALASIHDNATNIFLQSQVKAGSSLPVWIGFKRSDTDAFSWRDGSAVDFTNWASHYPRGATEDGVVLQCGQLSPWSGQWVDEECISGNGYVCMKHKVYETSAPTLGSTRGTVTSTPTPISTTTSATPVVNPVTPSATSVMTPSTTPRVPAKFTPGVPPLVTASQTSTTAVPTAASTTRAPTHTDKQTSGGGDNSSSKGGAIAGGVVGGVIVVVVVTLVVLFLVRRHRDRSSAGFTNVLYKDNAVQLS